MKRAIMEKLSKVRQNHTLEEIAEKTGLPIVSIWRMSNDKHRTSIDKWEQLRVGLKRFRV